MNGKKAMETIPLSPSSVNQSNSCKHDLSDMQMMSDPYLRRSEIKRTLLVVIAGDRGLAGGYNANVLKLAAQESGDVEVLPSWLARQIVALEAVGSNPITHPVILLILAKRQ